MTNNNNNLFSKTEPFGLEIRDKMQENFLDISMDDDDEEIKTNNEETLKDEVTVRNEEYNNDEGENMEERS